MIQLCKQKDCEKKKTRLTEIWYQEQETIEEKDINVYCTTYGSEHKSSNVNEISEAKKQPHEKRFLLLLLNSLYYKMEKIHTPYIGVL